MPSLGERKDDVPSLAEHFLRAACERNRFSRLELSAAAMRAVQTAEWPGNVRQLAHAIEAAAIRATGDGAETIERAHVFPAAAGVPSVAGAPAATFQESTRRFQSELVRGALKDADWNVAEVARRLELTRAHVYNLIRGFGLKRA